MAVLCKEWLEDIWRNFSMGTLSVTKYEEVEGIQGRDNWELKLVKTIDRVDYFFGLKTRLKGIFWLKNKLKKAHLELVYQRSTLTIDLLSRNFFTDAHWYAIIQGQHIFKNSKLMKEFRIM